MPTFRQIATPVVFAGLIAGALTGVLSAQTGPGAVTVPPLLGNVAGTETGTETGTRVVVSAPPDAAEPATADELFAAGLTAYQGGDVDRAVSIWEDAADDGHLAAQWNLAHVFGSDDTATHDARRRLRYLEMVARQHDPDAPPGPRSAITVEALVELGELYLEGDEEANIKPEAPRAFSIFQHSATLFGHPRAQHNLGLMYLQGEGINRDISQAVRWLFLSAQKQYAPAQAALGDFFWSRGSDLEDRLNGLMWLGLASKNATGEESGARFEERYEAAMSQAGEDVRPQVDAMISAWNQSNVAPAR